MTMRRPPETRYRVIDGVLHQRVLVPDPKPHEPSYRWVRYPGLCQGCRHPGDSHTCGKDGP